MQASQAGNRRAIEVIDRPRRDRDLHWHSTIHCFLRRAGGYHFDVIIATGFEIRLETPRDVLYARVGVRTL